jgi:hypothetical protein
MGTGHVAASAGGFDMAKSSNASYSQSMKEKTKVSGMTKLGGKGSYFA